jgi:hypothetical protein
MLWSRCTVKMAVLFFFIKSLRILKQPRAWHHVWHLVVNNALQKVVRVYNVTCEGNALNNNEVRLGKGRADNATFEYDTAKEDVEWGYDTAVEMADED